MNISCAGYAMRQIISFCHSREGHNKVERCGYHCADQGRWAEKRSGTERAKGTYVFRSLLDTGATLPFGTDRPSALLDPLLGLLPLSPVAPVDGKHPGGWLNQPLWNEL